MFDPNGEVWVRENGRGVMVGKGIPDKHGTRAVLKNVKACFRM